MERMWFFCIKEILSQLHFFKQLIFSSLYLEGVLFHFVNNFKRLPGNKAYCENSHRYNDQKSEFC